MQSQQILTKAIEKAITGGWTSGYLLGFHPLDAGGIASIYIGEGVQQLIYDHNFAKALWGEETQAFGGVPRLLMKWQYHLQQMVIAEDPIAYLGQNI